MVRRALLLSAVLAGCNFAPLDSKVLYRCQADRSCAQGGYVCAADLLCHPPGDDAGGAGGGAGGGVGGGAGGVGGGAGGGGCVSRACQPRECGKRDDGCGGMVSCPGCTSPDFCGGGGANRCGQQVCSATGWCWENPYPQGNFLRGAWAAAPDDVWAVGDVGTVLHFNGRRWGNIPAPTRANLRGVFGTGPNDIWLVGDLGTVLHWDGSRLLAESSGTTNQLEAVWARPGGVVWVAGLNSTLAMRSATGQWSLFAPAIASVNFRAIAGTGALDVWAVGDREVERFNGVKFVTVPISLPGGVTFSSVFVSAPDAVVAAGNAGLYATWDGGSWGVQQLNNNPIGRALFGSGATDLWLTTDRGVYRWVGGAMQLVVPGTPNLPYFAGAPLDGGEALVVGAAGSWALVAGDGGLVTDYAAAVGGPDLNDVFALNATTVVAVGGQNSWFERYANAGVPSWRRFACSGGFSQTMLDLWVAPSGTAYATATSNNTVAFKLGSSACVGGFDNLTYPGIFGFAGGPVHYVGEQWTEVMTDGGQPPVTTNVTNPNMGNPGYAWSAVWGSGPNEVFTVGTDGGIIALTDYDAGWLWAPRSPVTADLNAIYGAGAGSTLDVWAVGARGTMLRRQGAAPFALFDAGLTDDLRDVWVSGSDEAWVVGHDGGAWRFDGRRWSGLEAPVRDLRRLHGAPDAGVWGVGNAGAILFHP